MARRAAATLCIGYDDNDNDDDDDAAAAIVIVSCSGEDVSLVPFLRRLLIALVADHRSGVDAVDGALVQTLCIGKLVQMLS
jgi:hypothetical protein